MSTKLLLYGDTQGVYTGPRLDEYIDKIVDDLNRLDHPQEENMNSSTSVSRLAKSIIIASVVLGGLGTGIYETVSGIGRWKDGIYAGYHYRDAVKVVQNAMIVTYGKNEAALFRFARPPVKNVRQSLLLTGTGQVREFHLIGPRATRYCVSVWDPGINWSATDASGRGSGIDVGGKFSVKKGCTFS